MFYVFFTILMIILDQWTKYWASTILRIEGPLQIIEKQLSFIYVENRGAAFGILQDKRSFFIILTFGVLFYISNYLYKNMKLHSIWANLSFFLIIAGAIGNLIDRIRLHYVIDFIALEFGGWMRFPVFNMADIYVVVGAILLIFLIIFTKEFNL